MKPQPDDATNLDRELAVLIAADNVATTDQPDVARDQLGMGRGRDDGACVHDRADLLFVADKHSAAYARRWARTYLEAIPVPVSELATQDAELVVTELVSNAILHGSPPHALHLSHSTDSLLVRVEDSSGNPAEVRQPAADGGRGLRLVDCISTAWGQTRHDDDLEHAHPGKTVWAQVPLLTAR